MEYIARKISRIKGLSNEDLDFAGLINRGLSLQSGWSSECPLILSIMTDFLRSTQYGMSEIVFRASSLTPDKEEIKSHITRLFVTRPGLKELADAFKASIPVPSEEMADSMFQEGRVGRSNVVFELDRTARIHRGSVIDEFCKGPWMDAREETRKRLLEKCQTLDDSLAIGERVYILKPRLFKHGLASSGVAEVLEKLGSRHYRVQDLTTRVVSTQARQQLRGTGEINRTDGNQEKQTGAERQAVNQEGDIEDVPPTLIPVRHNGTLKKAGDAISIHESHEFPVLVLQDDRVYKVIGCEADKFVARTCSVDMFGAIRETQETVLIAGGAVRLLTKPGTSLLSRISLKIFKSTLRRPGGCAEH